MVNSKLIKGDKYFLSLFSFGSDPKILNKIFLQIASLLLPLLIWTIVCQLKLVSEMFLPSPLAVFYSLLDMAESGILFEDIFASTGRVFAGFIIATIFSIPLGILMGSFPSFCALCEPLIAMLRYMPAAAFSPLLIIYLGIEEAPKIALIFIGTVYFNVLMVMDSVKFVPKELIETTLTLGGNTKDLLIRVIARYSLPSIIDTLRIYIATSWNLVIVAELIAAEVGLGKRIQLAQRFFRTDQIFAELIVLGLIGFALDMSFRLLLRRTCKWAVYMKLDVNNISKYFGEGSNRKKAIEGISFSISSGEFKTLVGSSGSGKSTILRIIAGLESPSKGNVKVDGKIVSGPGLDRGMVFQKYSLFPWLTASENIAFGMNLNSYKLKEIKYKTSYLLEVVGLQDSGNKYPKELSGGMQQRIAIARALATNPKILLLDEPFGALDLQIRESMQKFLYELWKKTSLTVLLITHDIEEALALSQQICILAPNPGRIIKEVSVDLEKGDLDKLKLDSDFAKLRYELSDFLRGLQKK